MALAEQLPAENFLKERHISFQLHPHGKARTAKSEAEQLGLPEEYVLKIVMLRHDDGFAMAVLPASRKIDMDLLVAAVSNPTVRLATEDEIAVAFPAFELGAVPPLPDLLGVTAFVDPVVLDLREVAFADGKQTESIIADPHELFWGQYVVVAPISTL
jgi:Ala-tRNA(Pro) deacylase